MKTQTTFNKLYKSLNSAQRMAVDATEGPVMVVAGPGTGKTHMLTLRIANILRQSDASPDSILALTFTESAASGMRERLIGIIGSAAYRVHIHTFHGFCNRIIERHPDAFPRIIGSVHAGNYDQIRIMEDIIDSARLKILKPYGNKYHYVIEILGAIRELKRDAYTPGEFRKRIDKERKEFDNIPDKYYTVGRYAGKLKGKYSSREKELAKLIELATLYDKYEKELRIRAVYDYEDMIMETLFVLESNDDLLMRLQERYQYILADEHQDANAGQNKLLTLLSNFHPNPNLFVVGDEKQAIFRFQGASEENFLSFTRNYPEALVVRLSENYRSRQFILDAAHSVILHNSQNKEEMHGTLNSCNEKLKQGQRGGDKQGLMVNICAFSEAPIEHWFVAEDIREAIAQGERAEDIAILYRANRDRLPFVAALESAGIAYSVLSDDSILDDPEIEKMVALLRAINSPHKVEFVGRSLFIDFLGIDPYDAFAVFDTLGRKGSNLDRILRSHSTLEKAGLSDTKVVMGFYRKLLSWSAFAKNRGLMEALEVIARESGFFSHLLVLEDGHETIRKFDRLIAEFAHAVIGHRHYTLRDALRHMDTLAFYHVPIKASSDETANSSGVRLMTAHKSKGLEFNRVYIVGATDGHWGNRRRAKAFSSKSLLGGTDEGEVSAQSGTADERRLFYVALTRARNAVNITYSSQDNNGAKVLPSQFVEEIDAKHAMHLPTSRVEHVLRSTRNTVRASSVPQPGVGVLPKSDEGSMPQKRRELLLKMFEARGMSVSALNNYLKCPWQYFFENLIRLPHAPNRHQLYGIAVHFALKQLGDDLRSAKKLSKKRLLSDFERSLRRQPLSERDFEDSLAKGREVMAGYFDTYKLILSPPLETEFAIRGVLLNTGKDNPPVRLTGVLDKIELDHNVGSPTSNISVSVTDYKTGRSRSRNYIEGKTKDSSGDYKRQLVFYKLLLDNFADGKYQMNTGEIDFVEPDERGKYRKERFDISDGDTSELSETIRDVVSQIRSLSFWQSFCTDVKCEYCKLRRMMRQISIIN